MAKLLETGLVNLNRVEVLWRPVTNHLLEVSGHPLNRMREWGIEAITTLVRSAIQYQHSTSLKENQVNNLNTNLFFITIIQAFFLLNDNLKFILFFFLEIADIVNIAFE